MKPIHLSTEQSWSTLEQCSPSVQNAIPKLRIYHEGSFKVWTLRFYNKEFVHFLFYL